MCHTEEVALLAHGGEAGVAVVVERLVAGGEHDEAAVARRLATPDHRRLQEAPAVRRDRLQTARHQTACTRGRQRTGSTVALQ